ncbi:MAG: putative polyketide biosynthesis zinc-dependent hydrolase BaeB [Pelotomaculum sp. PtaB.Bin104]|nr:MAG: putative polyketide biosynthesis zinc-dependent hydrolase BaeB [Pelotomaculum sp. PtaB.Bin104]
MDFKQVYTPGLAHCSYVIGGKKSCVVVDPARDVEQYLQIAASLKLSIAAIVETHLHADFVSGHVELAERTGAKIYISKQAGALFEHIALADGEEFTVDTLLFKMLDTPGHTPEGSVFIVSDLERGPDPALVFSGDTLLVGDAGRPDLFPDIKEELASKLYHSLRKIEVIGDNVELYPAHGAGSLCGKVLSSKLSSTIGTERKYNGALQLHPESLFVESFLQGMPEAPDHFSRCSAINRKGAAAVAGLPQPKAFSPAEVLGLLVNYLIVDTRDQLAFGAAHLPGAYGLDLKGNFTTFAGWVLPPDQPIILVLEEMADLAPALQGLYLVGLDNVVGYLEGGMKAWAASGYRTERLESISVLELKERLDKDELILIDTRLKSEWDEYHIPNAIHAPAPDVRTRYAEWMGDKPVAFICNSGNRFLLAASIMLKKSKMKNIINVIGGTSAWVNAGLPIV